MFKNIITLVKGKSKKYARGARTGFNMGIVPSDEVSILEYIYLI